MVKENRELEQTERGDFRIVSAPNGLWQFQRLIDQRSTEDRRLPRPMRDRKGNLPKDYNGSDVTTPWEDVGQPQAYEVAKGLLSEREATKPRKAVANG